jgi:predicted TIM-barrel fold metal-dependent hydrolase
MERTIAMRTITLEEHFATPAYLDGPGRRLKEQAEQVGGRFAALFAALLDIGDGRVAAMDAAGVTVQALSLTAPGVEQLDAEEAKAFARCTNTALADAVRRHPTRFFGLAALPIADPPAAIAELELALGEGGFKGVVINGHHRGRYLDDRFFWPVLARAERLKLPIYLTRLRESFSAHAAPSRCASPIRGPPSTSPTTGPVRQTTRRSLAEAVASDGSTRIPNCRSWSGTWARRCHSCFSESKS